ncbi:MAG: AI-2E family transporter [Treponema sp.]|nr:AI-2E family transporter [Treponema sp.]
MSERSAKNHGIFFLLLFLCIIAAGVILKVTASIVIPVAVAILLSLVFYPGISKLHEKLHFPWWLAILVVFVLFFAIIGSIANIITTGIRSILASLPAYEARLNTIYALIAERFNLEMNTDMTFFQNMWSHISIRNTVGKYALNFTNILYDFTRNLLLVVLFSVFLLTEMHAIKDKVRVAFPQNDGRVKKITHDIVTDVTRYISLKFITSLATGLFVILLFLPIKMKFVVVWGFLAFVLNFIPTFGSIISGVLTVLFALVQFYPSVGTVVYVAAVMLAINLVIGSIIEPRVQGENLGISPFIILVSLSLWGWMWGFVGMLIAVPLMVIVKIICENVSYLKPLGILLGSRPKQENTTSPTENQSTTAPSQTDSERPLP